MYFNTSINSAHNAVATPDINTSCVFISLVIRVFTTPNASFNSPKVATLTPVTA